MANIPALADQLRTTFPIPDEALAHHAAVLGTYAAAHFWREHQLRADLDPCLSGQQTVCEVSGMTVKVERRK